MALSAPVKALAFVVFIAAIAGATYGVRDVVGDTVESQLVAVSTPRAVLNVTPGHNATYVITISNRDTATRDLTVEIDGVASGRAATTSVRGVSNATVFVTVEVPASLAAGEHELDVRVLSGDRAVRERTGLLTLRVLAPGVGFEVGDVAETYYTGRLSATGRVFNTNDPILVGLGFPKTDSYRFSQGLLPIASDPRPNVVQGIFEGVLGMQPGETRTLSFPPELGYGPSTQEESLPRDDSLQRNITLRNDIQRVTREEFESFLNESQQRKAGGYQVDDVFMLDQNDDLWPYRVVTISEEIVEYKLVANPGDAFTIYPFWPDGSVVAFSNDTHVGFRTTPTTQVGEKITVKQYWPLMSELKSYNETHISIRNSPPVGYTFTEVSQLGQPREATVKELSETRILVALPSPNPLAGKDLTFDVTVLSIEK